MFDVHSARFVYNLNVAHCFFYVEFKCNSLFLIKESNMRKGLEGILIYYILNKRMV
jgi:hypothetical protein